MVQHRAGLRALGLLPTNGGIPRIRHFAQQIGPDADFYDDYELGNMKEQLLSDKPSFLFSKSGEWRTFLSETFHLWLRLSGISRLQWIARTLSSYEEACRLLELDAVGRLCRDPSEYDTNRTRPFRHH